MHLAVGAMCKRRIEDGTYHPRVEDVATAILRVWSGEETVDAWESQRPSEASDSA